MREVMQARMEADRQRMEEMEAHRQAQQEKMAEILQFMQTLGAAAGVTPPPGLFAPPPPPPHQFSTPVSMHVLVYMFMLSVKPQPYLKPSNVWYMFILSHTCNFFSFVQNQSAASNDPRTSPNLSPNQSGWPGW